MAPAFVALGRTAGHLFTESGQLFTESGQLFTESGRMFTESGRMFTESGQLFTESGRGEYRVPHLQPAVHIERACHGLRLLSGGIHLHAGTFTSIYSVVWVYFILLCDFILFYYTQYDFILWFF
jgi:hypothetical protein